MSVEKYKQAWEKFQNKMASLKKRRHEILKIISEKLDKQHIEAIRKQMKNYELKLLDLLDLRFFSFVRTKAGPLPGLTCWNSTNL